ncbi:SNF2-related protein [Hymenobacter properus]|uniref:Helicase n=1 Tax=Hymenobacter properus TaxID=2791026 RepID=A0A931FGT9_9BACT|nr:SNF2-related protein [Hymenobacter properus]MBF9140307.1 hypothetical protein [Hymenobacter properus]MBR7719114.1 hypothetical protein [Microvirga sp. SRT04]
MPFHHRRPKLPKLQPPAPALFTDSGESAMPTRMTWPDHSKFPVNYPPERRQVFPLLEADLRASPDFLAVTGFTSLSFIIELFGLIDLPEGHRVRLTLGFAPEGRARKNWPKVAVAQEIRNYWLERRFSIIQLGAVLRTAQLLREGRLQVRAADHLHAKIYIGAEHATVGSSNLSDNGTRYQPEANLRVARTSAHLHEREQYDDCKLAATNFWDSSTTYTPALLELLEKLIQPTSWQEALARAVAELRRGKWLAKIEQLLWEAKAIPLWPSQRDGLAQALLILHAQGNVLIADPTGSGKTRLISTLRLALMQQLIERGHGSRANVVVVSPPAVCEDWLTELRDVGMLSAYPVSMGKLSNPKQPSYLKARADLALADILIVDEAHRFIRATSNRSEALGAHAGQYAILATATPINQRPQDLLRLLELLDVDNLPDDQLAAYKRLWQSRFGTINRNMLGQLRDYVRQFLVRRTKRQLNENIALEPDAYRNRLGERCRFPLAVGEWYQVESSAEDLARIAQINQLATQLRGLLHLRRVRPPVYSLNTEAEIREYFTQQVRLASHLNEYLVRHRLRSSTPALLELIYGTAEAAEYNGGFQTTKKPTGNMIGRLRGVLQGEPGRLLPRINAVFNPKWFPEQQWLWDRDAYVQACEDEMATYEAIGTLARQLQPSREHSKARLLYGLLATHPLVLAFDQRLITLDYLRHLIDQADRPSVTAYVVSGHDKKAQAQLRSDFALGSAKKQTVALCSDAVAESINLQQASAIVLLDMPGVLRLAEQRQGRVERLDSPHTTINIFWPRDPELLQLNADQRLREVIGVAHALIGGNLDLPTEPEALVHSDEILGEEELFDALRPEAVAQREASQWAGLTDSFQLVRELVEGPTALVPPEVYAQVADLTAGALCRINLLASPTPWSFFALPGEASRPPRWVLWRPNAEPNFTTDLRTICTHLRETLRPDSVAVSVFDPAVQAHLQAQVILFRQAERALLPPRKARALKVMEFLIKHQVKSARAGSERANLLKQAEGLFGDISPTTSAASETVPDYDDLAHRCLNLLRPALQSLRERPRRPRQKRPLITLNSLRQEPETFPELSETTLTNLLAGVREIPAADYRVVACIVGIIVEATATDSVDE